MRSLRPHHRSILHPRSLRLAGAVLPETTTPPTIEAGGGADCLVDDRHPVTLTPAG